MIRILVALLTILTFHESVWAQHRPLSLPLDTSTAIKRPYDVIGYKILLDWRPVFKNKTSVYQGVSEITVTSSSDSITEIVLDAIDLRVDTLYLNGVVTALPVQMAGDSILHIPLPAHLRPKGTNIVMRICYTHTNPVNPSGLTAGFLYYPKGTVGALRNRWDSVGNFHRDTEFVQEDLAYTMSESLDARRWMPCNDEPYDKANSEIAIIVPSPYSAQSNGTLQSVDSNSDGSRTYHWKSDRPISTYLMCASASKWTEWKDYYHRVSVPNDSVPLVFFAWPQDYDGTGGTGYNGKKAYQNTWKMMDADSRAFGEYPFKQYGQIQLEPFAWGGMEHQSMTANSRSVMDSMYPDQFTIAHELFHQWFGDKTTCETWADVWLNESFATFGEMFWAEHSFGHSGYLSYLRMLADRYMNSSPTFMFAPIYGPPTYQDAWATDYVANTYYKGGCVLAMLRRVLDDDTLFYNTLRDYSAAYAYTSANTFQFRNYLQERAGTRSPIDLFDYVDQWIIGPAFPIYSITWSQDNLNKLYVHVQQTQEKADHFTMPLRFLALTGSDTTNLTFINNIRTQSFTAQLDHPIESLVFDTTAIPIAKFSVVRNDALSVAVNPNVNEQIRVSSDGSTVRVNFVPIQNSNAVLRIVDLLGRTVLESGGSSGLSQVTFGERSMPNGEYLVILIDGSRRAVTRFQLAR